MNDFLDLLIGANCTGDLKDPQKSLPKGTLLAAITTFATYIVFAFVFAATTEGAVLRDKYVVLFFCFT
jgi:amino acid transporter